MSVEQEIIKVMRASIHSPERSYDIMVEFYKTAFNAGFENAKENVDDWLSVERAEQIVLNA